MNYNLIFETDRETLRPSLGFSRRNSCKSYASPRPPWTNSATASTSPLVADGNRGDSPASGTASSWKPCCCGRCARKRRSVGATPPWQRTSRPTRLSSSRLPRLPRWRKRPPTCHCRPCGCCMTSHWSWWRSRGCGGSYGNPAGCRARRYPGGGRCRWGSSLPLPWAEQTAAGCRGGESAGCL